MSTPLVRILRIACFAVAVCFTATTTAAPPSPSLTVFAAASLKESMDEAAIAYQKVTGQPVRVSYAGSSALARQIEQGAPADVFISADLDWMDELQRKGLIDTSSRHDLLRNTLVLVAPKEGRTKALTLQHGSDLQPLLGSGGRIALALVDSVPAGKYAKAAFTSLGMWAVLQPRVAEAENVRAALLLVARGETPLGVVYGSDARAEPRVRVLATFPADSHPPIVYPVARIRTSAHPQATAFVRWLRTPVAATIFRNHGLATR